MAHDILIIDDEEVIRDGCCQVLSRKGYPVESTGDATRGLEMALRDVYDVILLDIRMPLFSGLWFRALVLASGFGDAGHVVRNWCANRVAARLFVLRLSATRGRSV